MKEYNIKDVLTLHLKDKIDYQIYLPGKDTDYIQKKIYEEDKPYEQEMLEDIVSRLNKGDVILDIGANIGNHTLFFTAHGMTVHAFEANKDLFDIMNISIEINNFQDRVKTYNVGLSDKKDIAFFAKTDLTNLGGQSLTLGEGTIEVLPLDEFTFDSKVSLIKIDVEGMETNVLRGAFNLIKNDRPILYIEAINHVEFKAIFSELEKLSYVYWETFNATPTHLFLPKENVSEKDMLSRNSYRNTYESYRMTQQLNLSKRVSKNVSDILSIYKNEIITLKKDLFQAKTQCHSLEAHLDSSKQEYNNLQQKYDSLQNEYNKLDKVLAQETTKSHSLEANLDSSKQKYNFLQEKVSKLEKVLVKKTINYNGMSARNEKLKKIFDEQELKIDKLKKSISYRLGKLLIGSTKSPKAFIKLPLNLVKLFKEGNRKRKNKQQVRHTKQYKKLVNKKTVSNFLKLDKHQKNSKLKVASIMDEFTFNSFKHECDLMQITPESWKEELTSTRPDFVFVESAWQGKDSLWKTKISNASSELIDMLKWCRQEKIPTLFWNKEDPVHFDTFIETASLVDFVFTTDIDCVAKYKKVLNHDRVNFLPFAAQPFTHNPVELYERKDAFNFAGSYYLRYPERQRDFKSLINAVKEFRPVDIFDRNHDNPHPHYTFPSEYKPMILGKLPFEEIDKAYKGYRYGINMNTIKQSQSMFARRVYELLASNTITVSNFSRGLRLLFGDLVISSDNTQELSRKLEQVCGNETTYRKLRLLGLRKVMSEHTYADRLTYIISKLSQTTRNRELPKVSMLATVNSVEELNYIIKVFNEQTYQAKKLFIIKNFVGEYTSTKDVIVGEDRVILLKLLTEEFDKDSLFGYLNPNDYYGVNYLIDLAYASTYSDATVFGKASYYHYDKTVDKCVLIDDNKQYHFINQLSYSSSLIRSKEVTLELIEKSFNNLYDDMTFDKMLGVDEFNYCRHASSITDSQTIEIVNDLTLDNQGVSFTDYLSKVSESTLPLETLEVQSSGNVSTLDAKTLFELFPTPASSRLLLEMNGGKFKITSKLAEGKHAYIYANKQFNREELNLVLNSKFTLEVNSNLALRTVFEFQDVHGEKISHAMNPAGGTHALAIPSECHYVRFGLRIEGKGEAEISNLFLGEKREQPNSILGRSPYLVLTKQYPSYSDLYKYGFLHSRVRAYKEQGLNVEVFRIMPKVDEGYREFEGVDIASGDLDLLDKTLSQGMYKHVLVHFLDKKMWSVLKTHIDNIKVTVWVHGAEIQVWQRREFEFELMEPFEIKRQKKLSEQRKSFWQEVLQDRHPNLNLVFVSKYFANEVSEDMEIILPEQNDSIIHNYIDTNLFSYTQKNANDRLNLLSIRPYASRKYANDLTINAILKLSKKEFFNELHFTLIGDGILFDELTAPLKSFLNVKILKKFLTHEEIAKLHKEYGVFLTPTRMDAQGVSRDEAMSSGLVPITTNVAAIPEFVDEQCGMIVEPENPQALADAIEELYYNPEKFMQLSQAASQRVRQQCSFDETIVKEIDRIKSI